AQVQGLPRALLTVDNILKAEGKSTQDEEGGTWKVTRVKEQGDGGVTIGVELVTDRRNAIRVMRGLRGGGVAWRRVRYTSSATGLSPELLTLLDEKGRPFKRTGIALQKAEVNRFGSTMEWDLTFQPEKNQGRPAKLVLRAARPTILAVPFTLKDVKLPK